MKEIDVRSSYLALEKDIIGCQNQESYNDCMTRNYLSNLMETCSCLPFTIRTSNKVTHSEQNRLMKWYTLLYPLCNAEQMRCVGNVTFSYNSQCLPKCEGLHIPGFAPMDIRKKNKKDVIKLSNQYDKYKEVYDFTKFKGMANNNKF